MNNAANNAKAENLRNALETLVRNCGGEGKLEIYPEFARLTATFPGESDARKLAGKLEGAGLRPTVREPNRLRAVWRVAVNF